MAKKEGSAVFCLAAQQFCSCIADLFHGEPVVIASNEKNWQITRDANLHIDKQIFENHTHQVFSHNLHTDGRLA